MKKFVLIMVAVIGFGISTFAKEPFRWSGCNNLKQRIELYSDNGAVFIDNDGARYEGKYTWSINNGTSGNITITLNIGQTLRGNVTLVGHNFYEHNWAQHAMLDIEGERFTISYCR